MEEYKRLMFEELSRIADSSLSELRIARQREANVEQQVQTANQTSARAGKAQVQLRELQRESDSYKTLYQTFLQRYQEALQQRSFPITDARVISRAQVPGGPSSPKFMLVIIGAALAGIALGVALAVLREFRDRFFRNGEQIQKELSLEYLGSAPLLVERPVVVGAGAAARLSSDGNTEGESQPNLSYVVRNPLTPFAEALRNTKLAVDVSNEGKQCKVVGILSTLPGEGKTTIAINFAELVASQGARVLLIDGDIRSPGATKLLGDRSGKGLVEVLQREIEPRDAIFTVSPTRLAFLPTVPRRRISYSSELLASKAMTETLAWLRQHYDYIVFDLPPLAPVVDSRAIASKIDAFIYVVEWGKTTRSVVRRSLEENDIIDSKCVGALLSKVDRRRFALYQSYGSKERYLKDYGNYYTFQ
jgi:succinoglycan biosynthesis transport protein ExoP